MELPNSLRIGLLLLSFVSFLPQLRLLYTRRDSPGLSLFYVLFNLIVATELFTFSFFCLVNHRFEAFRPHVFVHDPPNVGDFINLVQFALIWVLWLVIFIASLTRRSDPDRGRRITVSAIYLSFLLISVISVFIDAITVGAHDQVHKWDLAIFGALHIKVVNPVVNTLGVAAVYAQSRVINAKPSDSRTGMLSMVGLAAQAVVFALLAVSWLWRLPFPWEELELDVVDWAAFRVWFGLVGFVPFNYAVFAIAQAVLFWLAVRHRRYYGDIVGASDGKIKPLLGD